jgi:hypothetical protein
MRTFITAAAATFVLAAAVPAYASSDDAYCNVSGRGQQLSSWEISARVTNMGYTIHELERDDGCFKVHATDKSGGRFEIRLDPVSGQIVKSERGW